MPSKKPPIKLAPRSSSANMFGGMDTPIEEMSEPKPKKGFKAVQAEIAEKESIPMKNAGAILASSTRKASPAAKKANPSLKKVR